MAYARSSSIPSHPRAKFEEGRGYKPKHQWRFWQLARRAESKNSIIQEKSRRAGSTEAFAGDAIEYGCGIITRREGETFKLPHGYEWKKRAEYTGDPREDCGLPDWYIDYLKAHATEDGVYDQVQWSHEPATFYYAIVPEYATNVYIIHATKDLAQDWLQERVLGVYWPKYIPLLQHVYGNAGVSLENEEDEEDDEEEATRNLQRKLARRKDVSTARVLLPSGRKICALATSRRNQGMGGTVLWDEAAIIEPAHQREIEQAVKSVNDLGGKLIIASRHNGRDVPFYEMVERAKIDKNYWAVPFINLYTAIIQGARKEDGTLIDIDEIKGKLKRDEYRQQYLCDAKLSAGGASNWPESEMIEFRRGTRNPESYMKWTGEGWVDVDYAVWPDFHLKVWQKPVEGVLYCIGADFATGRSHDTGRENATAFEVCYAATGTQVAEAHGLIPAYEAAKALAALGEMFNNAYLVPEFDRIGPGSQAVEWLTGFNGTRMYPDHLIHKESNGVAGVTTAKPTRNNMLDVFTQWTRREVLEAMTAELPSAVLVREMAAFQWNEAKQKYSGYPRDDTVTAMALAVHGMYVHRKKGWRTSNSDKPPPPPPPTPWEENPTDKATPYWELGLEPINVWSL